MIERGSERETERESNGEGMRARERERKTGGSKVFKDCLSE